MNISYEQIKAFVAVAECGSFSAAAKRLGKHRTTLGQVITNLEIEVNMTLLDRSHRYPELTEEGTALYQHAKNLAETTKSFERICQNYERGNESQITVCHSELVPEELVRDVMLKIREKYPLVRVNWRHKHNDEVKMLFDKDEADLAIILVPAGDATSASAFTYLLNLPFTLCATPEFIERHELRDLSSLKRTRQLLMSDLLDTGVSKTLTISNFTQQIESINMLKTLLVSGEGWAIVPRHSVQAMLKRGELKEIELEELNVSLQFPLNLWQHNHKSGPIAKEMVRLFKECSHTYCT